jgi:hypothetical protein
MYVEVVMKRTTAVLVVLGSAMAMWTLAHGGAQAQQPPTIQMPQPGVPQIMTIEGNFVRASYNNEGYVIIGYQMAQRSLGEEWMLIEMGATVLDRVPDYKLLRQALSLETPDGKTIPLATVEEYRGGDVRAVENRSKVQRDSINYFPPSAHDACRIGFFAPLESRAMPWDEVELSTNRACLGRIFFKVPGGITYGQHWLNVKFEKSLVRVPFRILTQEEEKMLSKNFGSIKKQIDNAFRKKS